MKGSKEGMEREFSSSVKSFSDGLDSWEEWMNSEWKMVVMRSTVSGERVRGRPRFGCMDDVKKAMNDGETCMSVCRG